MRRPADAKLQEAAMFNLSKFRGNNQARDWDSKNHQQQQQHQQLRMRMSPRTAPAVERWVDEQMFEEDLRAVLLMMRPNRRERLMGWNEYRTGGRHFRATVSLD